MHACLRCRTLVDTNILLYLCCSAQGRLKVFLLCLRYLDTVLWLSKLCFCLRRGVCRRIRFENKNFAIVCVFLGGHGSQSWYNSFDGVSPRRAPPSSHGHLAIGTPHCHDLDWEERLYRELATLTQTHVRASCCCYCVAVLRLVVLLYYYYLLLPTKPCSGHMSPTSRANCNEKKKKRGKKEKRTRWKTSFVDAKKKKNLLDVQLL